MKARFLALMILLAVIASIVTITIFSKNRQARKTDEAQPELTQQLEQDGEDHLKVTWLVKYAKSKGETRIDLLQGFTDYGWVATNLKDAANKGNFVVASPVEIATFIDRTDRIITWNRFVILESITSVNSEPCCEDYEDNVRLLVPPEIYPQADDEFVLPQFGGTVVKDGVTVSQPTHYSPYKIGARYLLFVTRLGEDPRIVDLINGPMAAFEITDDDQLMPVEYNFRVTPIALEIHRSFKDSLSEVKKYLKKSKRKVSSGNERE